MLRPRRRTYSSARRGPGPRGWLQKSTNPFFFSLPSHARFRCQNANVHRADGSPLYVRSKEIEGRRDVDCLRRNADGREMLASCSRWVAIGPARTKTNGDGPGRASVVEYIVQTVASVQCFLRGPRGARGSTVRRLAMRPLGCPSCFASSQTTDRPMHKCVRDPSKLDADGLWDWAQRPVRTYPPAQLVRVYNLRPVYVFAVQTDTVVCICSTTYVGEFTSRAFVDTR